MTLINDIINFNQSQLLLAKTNQDRTTSLNAILQKHNQIYLQHVETTLSSESNFKLTLKKHYTIYQLHNKMIYVE